MANTTIPWVEKYRPTSFDEIVLDDINQKILKNIIQKNIFPNLLLYGPPGTGKTTTIINLVNAYQKKYNQKSKGLMIHLNASDERGIDIIRNQISQFVNSSALFVNGLKIVVLDEVDYMTKNAQQALKYLLHEFTGNVRFCLICNYISRIDESLQNEFLHLRFNQLPSEKIIEFLTNISHCENIELGDNIQYIQKIFKSDIRSMINYMQSNYLNLKDKKVISKEVWEDFTQSIKSKNGEKKIEKIEELFSINIKNIIKDYLNHVISNHERFVTKEFLDFSQSLLHLKDPNFEYLKIYFLKKMEKELCK
jgi:replication factor C subunit 3/5